MAVTTAGTIDTADTTHAIDTPGITPFVITIVDCAATIGKTAARRSFLLRGRGALVLNPFT
jgi:hypothetical protein